MKKILIKILDGCLAAFVVFTAVEFVWGYYTPGDYYGNGSVYIEWTLM